MQTHIHTSIRVSVCIYGTCILKLNTAEFTSRDPCHQQMGNMPTVIIKDHRSYGTSLEFRDLSILGISFKVPTQVMITPLCTGLEESAERLLNMHFENVLS